MTVDIGTFATWEGCPDCSGGPAPGARAILAYWLEIYEPLGRSLGIYDCRNVRGAGSLSIHACGRAADLGVPVSDEGHAIAYEFLARIGPHVQRLGVQLVIFNREYGSARNPWPTRYGGTHPHRDHIHIEVNNRAGRDLNLATLRSVVGDFREEEHPEPDPEPTPPSPDPAPWREEIIANMDRLSLANVQRPEGSRANWRRVQSLLAANNFIPANTFDSRGVPDGIPGRGTRDALGRFQRTRGTGARDGSADWIVGPNTWRSLLTG